MRMILCPAISNQGDEGKGQNRLVDQLIIESEVGEDTVKWQIDLKDSKDADKTQKNGRQMKIICRYDANLYLQHANQDSQFWRHFLCQPSKKLFSLGNFFFRSKGFFAELQTLRGALEICSA
jgi:hypothetical protein